MPGRADSRSGRRPPAWSAHGSAVPPWRACGAGKCWRGSMRARTWSPGTPTCACRNGNYEIVGVCAGPQAGEWCVTECRWFVSRGRASPASPPAPGSGTHRPHVGRAPSVRSVSGAFRARERYMIHRSCNNAVMGRSPTRGVLSKCHKNIAQIQHLLIRARSLARRGSG